MRECTIGVLLASVLIAGAIQFDVEGVAYGQFFENSEDNGTNSSNFVANSTSSDESATADIVLLSQKLKKASFGYRDLVGQVKNVGNDTATYVKIVLDTFDENGDILGTDYTYVTSDTLKPNQKSSFELSSESQNFKGMDHYEISLQWSNSDGTEGYTENAQLFKSGE